MPFSIDRVVPWGRSAAEYRAMFGFDESNLGGGILGCGDGPASFNAEMSAQGHTVVSVDPLYAVSAAAIERRVEETFDEVMDQMRQNAEEFVWTHVPSVDELGRRRMAAMRRFLADYARGKAEGRYVEASLPELPFDDGTFDQGRGAVSGDDRARRAGPRLARRIKRGNERQRGPQGSGPTMTTTRYPEADALDTLWPEHRIETLLPARCFDAEPAGEQYMRLLRSDAPGEGSGADSPTIQLWLGCRCAGWVEPPTGEEFHAAIRAGEPSRRQIAILDAWANQAAWTEALQAWAEHAYTLRELAAALHRAGLARCRLAATLNRWASHAERLQP